MTHDLNEAMKRLMVKGSPLSEAILADSKSTKVKTERKRKSKRKPPSTPYCWNAKLKHLDEDDLTNLKNFTYNNTPYEATLRQNTLTLVNLDTYESQISPYFWSTLEQQYLHIHLLEPTNWEYLNPNDTLDAYFHPLPTFED